MLTAVEPSVIEKEFDQDPRAKKLFQLWVDQDKEEMEAQLTNNGYHY